MEHDDIKTLYNNDLMRVNQSPFLERYALWDELFVQETTGVSPLQLTALVAKIIFVVNILRQHF